MRHDTLSLDDQPDNVDDGERDGGDPRPRAQPGGAGLCILFRTAPIYKAQLPWGGHPHALDSAANRDYTTPR